MGHVHGLMDIGPFGRTGGNEPDTHLFRGQIQPLHGFPPGIDGSSFRRSQDGQDLFHQFWIFGLDQPEDGRTGRRNQGERPFIMGNVAFHLITDIVPCQGHIEYGVEPQFPQTFPDHRSCHIAVELGVERRGGQSDIHFVLFQFGQTIRPAFHSPGRTAADAFSAVDAAVGKDDCFAVAHPDGLDQTVLHTD